MTSPAWQVQFTRSEEIGIVIELLRSIELYEPLLECDGRQVNVKLWKEVGGRMRRCIVESILDIVLQYT